MDRSRDPLKRQLKFQEIVSNIAKTFVSIGDLPLAINNSLKTLGEFSGASRAYIFEFSDNHLTMDNTYEWCAPGVSQEKENLQGLPTNIFPWWISKLRSGEVLNIEDVKALGEDARSEREILDAQGIQSVLVLPIVFKDDLRGFVGFDHIHKKGPWVKEDASLLKIASEFYSSVFERLESERELRASNRALESSLNSLKEAQTKLFQQEKTVAIGQLASGIAHEINNPLSFAYSNQAFLQEIVEDFYQQLQNKVDENQAKLLKEKYDEAEELFADIDEGLQRVIKIVKSLRFYAQTDAFSEFQLYDLREGLEHIVELLSYRVNKGIKINYEFIGDIPPIYVDAGKMNDVLMNLFINALDAIDESTATKEGLIDILVEKKKAQVALSIRDNGVGMSPEVQKQIFNPFFTTKEVGTNTGLGLNIVYDIINNKHKGKILVESTLGEGTQVQLILPTKIQE